MQRGKEGRIPWSDEERRKRLGQYFTGEKLARLLTALLPNCPQHSAIDPMCGTGDMLVALKENYHTLVGVDIDEKLVEVCGTRLAKKANTFLLASNAFSPDTIAQLPVQTYDLVITNPPYVRYQNFSEPNCCSIPSSSAVRNGLLNIAKVHAGLTVAEKELFRTVIKGYSGLADLTIPAWILCCLLVKQGGYLALVVPDAWQRRDYGLAIQYLLLRLFELQIIIEDTNSIWFPEAQIKTNIIIARRIPLNDGAPKPHQFIQVELAADAGDDRSLVGNLYPQALWPEQQFTQDLLQCKTTSSPFPLGVKVNRKKSSLIWDSIQRPLSEQGWFKGTTPTPIRKINPAVLPQDFATALNLDSNMQFFYLDHFQWQVGQGLRTGANLFFYTDIDTEGETFSIVKANPVFGGDKLELPNSALLPVLRKQNELQDSYKIKRSDLPGRVLLLHNLLHPEDYKQLSQQQKKLAKAKGKSLMSQRLATFLQRVEKTNIGRPGAEKYVPNMSAVRTNESIHDNRIFNRYWYMLPRLMPRHLPDLFFPRVIHLQAKCRANSPEKIVIDANFSTLWATEEAVISKYAILAYLSSDFAALALEFTGVAMGGGALKVEATHLRRLPVPNLAQSKWEKLAALGKALTKDKHSTKTMAQVNEVLYQEVFGAELVQDGRLKVESLLRKSHENRLKRR